MARAKLASLPDSHVVHRIPRNYNRLEDQQKEDFDPENLDADRLREYFKNNPEKEAEFVMHARNAYEHSLDNEDMTDKERMYLSCRHSFQKTFNMGLSDSESCAKNMVKEPEFRQAFDQSIKPSPEPNDDDDDPRASNKNKRRSLPRPTMEGEDETDLAGNRR